MNTCKKCQTKFEVEMETAKTNDDFNLCEECRFEKFFMTLNNNRKMRIMEMHMDGQI